MSTPLASRTTVSSRNKIATTQHHHISNNNNGATTTVTNNDQCNSNVNTINNKQTKSGIQPPKQISRPIFRTPAPPHHQLTTTCSSSQRLAHLANGLPISLISKTSASQNQSKQTTNDATTTTTTANNNTKSANQPPESRIGRISSSNSINSQTPAITNGKPISCITTKPTTKFVSRLKTQTTHNATRLATTSRIQAPRSKIKIETPSIESRSPSVLSSVSSATTTAKRTSNTYSNHPVRTHKPPLNNLSRDIPETNVTRKGLAKFSNPVECQRQFLVLNSQIQRLTDTNEARDKEIQKLQDQLEQTVQRGIVYATVVQYFAKVLNVDSEIDLPKKSKMLEEQINLLLLKEKDFDQRLQSVVDDYESRLQSEYDLKNKLISELNDTRLAHSEELEALKDGHQREINDLDESKTLLKQELETRLNELQSELESKNKEYSDLRREHEQLNNHYSKLEESLTKDKDAKVRYLQDKIAQQQKDVDSLNSVLEMRLEKIHALEKDSILLIDAQAEIGHLKDNNKALKQQLESLEAALERKREQLENLMVDHENIVQELKRERRERRRMTMKTEQLEYVLNESCADNNITVFNSSVSNIDQADQVS